MTLRIAQDFAYVGNDYWNWRAWIETSCRMYRRLEL